jgi:hypothetical protein
MLLTRTGFQPDPLTIRDCSPSTQAIAASNTRLRKRFLCAKPRLTSTLLFFVGFAVCARTHCLLEPVTGIEPAASALRMLLPHQEELTGITGAATPGSCLIAVIRSRATIGSRTRTSSVPRTYASH